MRKYEPPTFAEREEQTLLEEQQRRDEQRRRATAYRYGIGFVMLLVIAMAIIIGVRLCQ